MRARVHRSEAFASLFPLCLSNVHGPDDADFSSLLADVPETWSDRFFSSDFGHDGRDSIVRLYE